MSAVEFSDLTACARLITLVEGAARHSKKVNVVPPALNLRDGERDLITGTLTSLTDAALLRERSRVARSVQARRRGMTFLTNTGFFPAIQLPHLRDKAHCPKLQVDGSVWTNEIEEILSEVTSSELTAASPMLTPPDQAHYSPAILPFQWLTTMDSPLRQEWGDRFIEFLHGRDLIMTRRDAVSVVTTVLRELVDNVFEHAGVGESHVSQPPSALVAALNVRQARYVAWKKQDELYREDLAFNDWLSNQESPLVRILVADSGSGIPATLGESYLRKRSRPQKDPMRASELILHSFEPSASRHEGDRRGLGLATVGRFVRGYAGRIEIRAGNASGGFWYPKRVAERFAEDSLVYVPGTVVDVTLGMTIGGRLVHDHIVGPVTARAAADLVFGRTNYSAFRGNELINVAMELLRKYNKPFPVVVLSISGWPEERSDRIDLALQIRRVAKGLERRAGFVVILHEASSVDIRSTFAPLDELGEAKGSRSEVWNLDEWTPPALIIAADGSPTWTGASEAARRLLYSLMAGEAVDLDVIVRTFKRRSPERDFFLGERDWLAVDENGKAALRVTLTLIDDLVASQVVAELAQELARGGYESASQ